MRGKELKIYLIVNKRPLEEGRESRWESLDDGVKGAV